jgi:protein phosphatase
MEDSHVVMMDDTWGFFCICDGHGGDECSKFMARRLKEEFKDGPPPDDAGVSELALRLDREFLATEQQSGSTSTFVIIHPPVEAGGKYTLRVGNIGDSRVLLGRADGTIVEGDGTDGGLTIDHKPDYPSERERIERTGGHVQEVMGVFRVNGDLAVSRAYGDAKYKLSGGPSQEDHPVSAAPEFFHVECGPTDFVMLVCDGISEGDFPNRQVIKLAAEKLRETLDETGEPDLVAASSAVCRMALKQGSKDNLSCMIVLLGGPADAGPDCPYSEEVELIPGPFNAPDNPSFRKAYAAMSEHAGLSLVESVELRYDQLVKDLKDPAEQVSEEGRKSLEAAKSELELFKMGAGSVKTGPPSDVGKEERRQWFVEWLESQEGGSSDQSNQQLMELAAGNPRIMQFARQQGLLSEPEGPKRKIKVAPLEELKPAVENHPALKWDDRLEKVCGKEGDVLKDDETDNTSQVKFGPPINFQAWLPTICLTEQHHSQRRVRVAPLEELKAAIEANEALKWSDKSAEMAGQEGTVLVDDESDGTSQVRFAKVTAWMPSHVLTEITDSEGDGDSSPIAPGGSSGSGTRTPPTNSEAANESSSE